MRHLSLSFLTIVLLALLTAQSCSCSHKEQRLPGEADINPMVEELDETPDSALLVTLESLESDSLVVRVSHTGEQMVFGYLEAQSAGMIKGSLREDDEYSIFPDRKNRRITTSINVSELKGQWFYDMQQHRGMKFETRGGLSSINAGDISFRQWKLLNGKLYIYYLDLEMIAPDRHEYLVEEAQIQSLNKDELILQFRGKTYDCRRQHEAIKFNQVRNS